MVFESETIGNPCTRLHRRSSTACSCVCPRKERARSGAGVSVFVRSLGRLGWRISLRLWQLYGCLSAPLGPDGGISHSSLHCVQQQSGAAFPHVGISRRRLILLLYSDSGNRTTNRSRRYSSRSIALTSNLLVLPTRLLSRTFNTRSASRF